MSCLLVLLYRVPREMLLSCSLLADHLNLNASLEDSAAVSYKPPLLNYPPPPQIIIIYIYIYHPKRVPRKYIPMPLAASFMHIDTRSETLDHMHTLTGGN